MTEKPPLVTIILPTYNRAYCLKRAVKSLLNQTYGNFELLIVDDGSSDNTEDIVKSLGDARIKYLRHERNLGVNPARNTGLRSARGEFIAFQDSDDEWMPEKLERQIKAFESVSSEVGVVYTDLLRINEAGETRYWHSPKVTTRNLINPRTGEYQVLQLITGSVLIRRQCFDEVGFFDENFPRFTDLELFIRLSKRYDFKHIEEALYRYYATKGAITSDANKLATAKKLLLEKYAAELNENRAFLARQYFQIGFILCSVKKLAEGRRYLMKAARIRPWCARYIGFALISLPGQRVYDMLTTAHRKMGARTKSDYLNRSSG